MQVLSLCAAAFALAVAGADAARQGVTVGHGEAPPYAAAQRPVVNKLVAQTERFPACSRIDGFCPDAHPLMFNDPVPDFFRCKTDVDCNDHRCVQGKCQCRGGNLFNNCGAVLMYHREWEMIKRTRLDLARGACFIAVVFFRSHPRRQLSGLVTIMRRGAWRYLCIATRGAAAVHFTAPPALPPLPQFPPPHQANALYRTR